MPSILPVFTVDLDPQRPGSSRTIEIGKIDHSKANGDLQRAPVNNGSGFWQVDNITYEVAGKRVPGNHSMILGTSTLIAALPNHLDIGTEGESQLTNLPNQIPEDQALSMSTEMSPTCITPM